MNIDRRPEFSIGYGVQSGQRQSIVFHDSLRPPQTNTTELLKGVSHLTRWISRRYSRRPHSSGTGR